MATLEALKVALRDMEAELPPKTIKECAEAAKDPERLLAMMFKEAMDEGATSASRINALTVLIKAAGLLKESMEVKHGLMEGWAEKLEAARARIKVMDGEVVGR